MDQPPKLSESEWKIMRVLWRKSPLAAYDICQELEATETWHPNTVKTMLTRLCRKGALKTEKYKNLFLYSPAVAKADCVAEESSSFVDRVFGGAVKSMLVHFAEEEKLTDADIDELKELLKK